MRIKRREALEPAPSPTVGRQPPTAAELVGNAAVVAARAVAEAPRVGADARSSQVIDGQLGVRAEGAKALTRERRAAFSVAPEALIELYAKEIVAAHEFAASLKPAVSVFGSARTPVGDEAYEAGERWGETLLLANLFALDRERAADAVRSGVFSLQAAQAVSAAVAGTAVGSVGAARFGQVIGASGAAADPSALAQAAELLAVSEPQEAVLAVLLSVARSGAGPGIMDAVLRGYLEATQRLMEAQPDLPGSIRQHFEAQGSRIELPFEQATSEVFRQSLLHAPLHVFRHFDPRREALMLNATAVVSEMGGIGTLNEDFVALRRGLPVIFNAEYYGEIMGAVLEQWRARGFSPNTWDQILLREGTAAGFSSLVAHASEKPRLEVPTVEEARQKARDFVEGITALAELDTAVSVLGSSRLAADDPSVACAARIAGRIASAKIPVRLGGGGELFQEVSKAVQGVGPEGEVQGVLLKDASTGSLAKGADVFHTVSSPNVHKVMLYENTDGMIFAPGGDGVFDEFFEVWCLIQTKKLGARPLILIDDQFWGPILEKIEEKMARTPPATISPEDMKLLKVVKTSGPVTEADASRPYPVVTEEQAVSAIRTQRARRYVENV